MTHELKRVGLKKQSDFVKNNVILILMACELKTVGLENFLDLIKQKI